VATKLKNLSSYNPNTVPSAKEMRFGIAVADWNDQITYALLDGAIKTLKKHGTPSDQIMVKHVPGTFELTFAANILTQMNVDAVIVLGCVIQGETRHFDFICQGVTQGITHLNVDGVIPVIFGILTTENLQQAIDRAGGKHGNKGDEAAVTAIKMVALNNDVDQEMEDLFE